MDMISRAELYVIALLAVAFISAWTLLATPKTVGAAEICSFSEDLYVGSISEEVRCLQRYLNSNGFVVASEGVGSPGKETTMFRDKTKDAVTQWQISNGLSPATGTFGAKSRAKYLELITKTPASTPVTTPSTTTVIPAPVVVVPTVSTGEQNARKAIEDARNEFDSADEAIEKADDDEKNTESAVKLLKKGEVKLLEAFYAYFDRDYDEAIEFAKAAQEYGQDARSDIKKSGKKDGLTYAVATVFANETVVKVRFDGKEYIFSTDETDEDELIDEIIDEVDDNDLSTKDVAKELDVNNEDDRDSTADDKEFNDDDLKDAAEDAIKDAEDAVEEAEEEIEQAEDEDRDTNDAEDYLNEAEDALNDAEDAYDDEDYDEALDLADEAISKAEDAVDEIE